MVKTMEGYESVLKTDRNEEMAHFFQFFYFFFKKKNSWQNTGVAFYNPVTQPSCAGLAKPDQKGKRTSARVWSEADIRFACAAEEQTSSAEQPLRQKSVQSSVCPYNLVW